MLRILWWHTIYCNSHRIRYILFIWVTSCFSINWSTGPQISCFYHNKMSMVRSDVIIASHLWFNHADLRWSFISADSLVVPEIFNNLLLHFNTSNNAWWTRMSFFINCLLPLHSFITTSKLSHGSYSYCHTEMCHSTMNSASFHNQKNKV